MRKDRETPPCCMHSDASPHLVEEKLYRQLECPFLFCCLMLSSTRRNARSKLRGFATERGCRIFYIDWQFFSTTYAMQKILSKFITVHPSVVTPSCNHELVTRGSLHPQRHFRVSVIITLVQYFSRNVNFDVMKFLVEKISHSFLLN